MDYFLFNFSGVQFHYTMSHSINSHNLQQICNENVAYANILLKEDK